MGVLVAVAFLNSSSSESMGVFLRHSSNGGGHCNSNRGLVKMLKTLSSSTILPVSRMWGLVGYSIASETLFTTLMLCML